MDGFDILVIVSSVLMAAVIIKALFWAMGKNT